MKNLFIVWILMTTILPASFSQELYVIIKVTDTVINKKTNKQVVAGDKFFSTEDIAFKSAKSRLSVVHPIKGRMIVLSQNNNTYANYVPALSNISSRNLQENAPQITNLEAVRSFFSDKVVIIDALKLPINKVAFSIDSNHFFYITYLKGNQKINKKLKIVNDSLVMDLRDIFSVDGIPQKNPDSVKMEISYFSNKNSQIINSFMLVIPDPVSLKKETGIILDVINRPKKELANEVFLYINETYGKFSKDSFKSYFNSLKY